MYAPLQLAGKYLRYYLTAHNGKGHGIHSPFVYQLVREVLNDGRHFYAYNKVERLRRDLLHKTDMLQVEDLGAGSGTKATSQRSIRSIARHAAKPPKLGKLLFRLVLYFQPAHVLELGTSLGLTTGYLAAAKSSAQVVTIEGSEAIAQEAAYHFHSLGLHNIRQVAGNFDEVLAPTLAQIRQVDFAFVDGNHRLAPTLHYFEQMLPYTNEYSVLVFDDIHWSAEMEQAWETIKADQRVRLTIDLFFIGLVFFRREFKEKQDFVIRF
jgi:predicted O-methyltransferase YrrM